MANILPFTLLIFLAKQTENGKENEKEQEVNEIMEKLKAEIETVREKHIKNIDKIEKIYSTILNFYQKGAYDKVLSEGKKLIGVIEKALAKEEKEGVKEKKEIEKIAREKFEECRIKWEEMQKKGLPGTPKIQEMLAQVEKDLSAQKFEDALRNAEKLLKAENILVEEFEKATNFANDLKELVAENDVLKQAFEGEIEGIKGLISEGDYRKAIELATELIERVRTATYLLNALRNEEKKIEASAELYYEKREEPPRLEVRKQISILSESGKFEEALALASAYAYMLQSYLTEGKKSLEEFDNIFTGENFVENALAYYKTNLFYVKAKIEEGKEFKVGTEDAENLLSEAEKFWGERKYGEAFDNILLAKSYIYTAIENKLGDVISNIENFIAGDTAISTENLEKLRTKLEEARELVSRKDYRNANSIIAEIKTDFLKEREKAIAEMKNMLEKKVEEAEKYGIDLPGVKRLASIAERALAKEDYAEAVKHYKNAIEGLNAVIIVEVEKKIADAEKFTTHLKGLPESKFVAKLEEIKGKKGSADPLDLLKESLEVEKVFVEDVNKLIHQKLEMISQLENAKAMLGIEYHIPDIKCSGYSDAETALTEVENFVSQVNEKFKIAFEKLIEEGNRKLELAIPEMALSTEKELFMEFMKSIGETQWNRALDLYNQFNKSLEKNVTDFVRMFVREKLRPLNTTAQQFGLEGVPPKEIGGLIKNLSLENAKEIYAKAIDLHEGLEKEISRFIEEKIGKIKQSMEIAESIGFSLQEVKAKMELVNTLLGEKRYGEANNNLEEIRKIMASSLVDFVEKEIDSLKQLVNVVVDKNIEIGEIQTYLNDAETLLKRKNIISAHEKVVAGREAISKRLQEAAKEKEELLSLCIATMEKIGIHAEDIVEQSKSLENLRRESKFLEEVSLAHRLLEEATDRLAAQWLNLSRYTEEQVGTMERLGLGEGLRERLENAKMLASTNRMYEALIEITRLLAEIENLIRERAALMLEQLTYLAETGKQYGIEVTFESSALEDVRKSVEENRCLDALVSAYPIYKNYARLFETYLSEMLSGIHEGLRTLNNLSIEATPYVERVDNCQKYISENDWKNALEQGTALRTDIQSAIKKKVEEYLEEIEQKIKVLEAKGEDVSKLRFIKEVALEKLKIGDLAKAVSAVLSARESVEKTLRERLSMLLEYWRRIIEALEKYKAQPDMLEKIAILEERLKNQPDRALETDEELRKLLKEKMESKNRENLEKLSEIKNVFSALRMDWEKIENNLKSLSAKENFEVPDIQNIMGFIDNLNLEIKVKIGKIVSEFENLVSLIEESAKREEIKNTLNKAKELLNAGQVKEANLEIEKVADVLRKAIEEKIEKQIGEAERIIGAQRHLNLNFHIYENRYLEAKEHLAKEEYARAFEILENLIEQGEREIEEYMQGIEREIAEAIETMKKLEIDTSEINQKFGQVKEFAEKKDFESVAKAYRELKEILTKNMEENLIGAINQCDLLIEFALGLGIDVTHAKELLNKGKIRFASKMYVQAKNLIAKSLANTEESVRKYIANEINLVGPEIDMLAMLGLQTEDYKNQLEEAKRKLEARDYVGAQSSTVKVKKQVEDLLEENSAKMLGEIRACIEQGSQIGADTTLFERMYLTAQAFINGKNYEGLVRVSKDAKNKFIEVTNEVIRTNLEAFGKWLDILALHEISIENYVEIRNMAKNTMEAGNAVEAAKIIKNALNDMEITVKDKIVKTKDEIEARMNFLRKYGVQVSQVELGLKNISADLEARDYIEARKHIEQTWKELNQIAEIKARELLSSLKNTTGKLKIAGVPIADRSGELEVLITAGKHFEAINGYEAILDEVNQAFAKHILKIVEETEGFLTTSGNLLASTANFIETLKQVKALVESKAYDDAYQIAIQVRSHITSQIESKINATINEARDYLERFKTIGPDILSAAIIVNNANLSLSQKKYTEAYALASEAIDKIMKSVKEYTSKEIEDYKSFIRDCERIGIDVTKFREGVVNAEKLLRENKVFETYYTIKETKKLGDESMSAYLSARINDTVAKIEEAEHLGVDLSKVINLKNRVSSVQSSPNVLDALRELKSIEQEALAAGEEKVREVYNSINDLYTYFSGGGLTTNGVPPLLKSASDSIASKNLVEAMAALIDAEALVVETVETHIASELEKWKKFITFLMKIVPEFSFFVEQIKKAQDLLLMKDYRKAYTTLNELSRGVQSTVNEKLLPAFEAKLEEVRAVKNVGVDVSKVEVMLREATEKLRAGDYLKAKERFEDASMEFDKILLSYSNNEIEIFSKNLELAKAVGLDSTQYEKALAQIKTQISSGKYRDALLQLSNSQKELYSKLRSIIEKDIAKCIEEMEVVAELNIDFSEINALLESAKMKAKYMDMLSAYQMVSKAREQIPEIVRTQIAKEIENQLERGRKLKERGIDISPHEHFLHKAKERLDAGKYSEAKFLIVRYLNSILPVLEENFDKSIEYLKATINTAKTIGLKIEGEDTLWAEIKRHIRAGDYLRANEVIEVYQSNLIARIESSVNAEMQKFAALLEIANAYKCQPTGVAEAYAHTKTDFQSKRYINALQVAKQNIAKLEEVLSEKASIELKNIEADIEEARKYNVDTGVAERIVEEAKKRLAEKNYSLAFESISHAKRDLEQNVITFEKKLIEDYQRLMNSALEMKINTDQENVVFNNGKALYASGRLLEAIQPLVSAKEKIIQTIKSELRNRIETMNSTLELARAMNIDIAEIEWNLQNAQKSLLINNFEDCHKYITAATSKFVTAATATLGAEISKIEGIIGIGESVGCNLTQNRKELLKAKEMVVNKEFVGAKKYIDDIALRTKKTVASRVKEEIEGARAILALAKQFGLEVAKQQELIQNAENSVNEERYLEAYNVVIETKAYLVNSIVKFLNAEISGVNALLNESLSIGVPELAPAKENIENSVKKLHEMDFENAYKMLGNAKQHIVKNATEYLNALIKDAENILADAKNIEASVPEQIYSEIENARAYINQQRFRDGRDTALSVYEKGLNIARDKIQERMNVLNALLEHAKTLGIPVENAPETIRAITEMLAEKNFRGANKKCLELTKRVSDLLQNYCENQILNTAKLVDLAEAIGIKMIEIKRSVEGTWVLLRNKQYMEVVKITNDVQSQIHGMLDRFITEEIQKIQNEIRYAESIGANAARVKEMLASAQIKQREKDYTGAHRALKDTEAALEKVLARHISDSMSVARLTYDIGVRAGVDLSDIKEKFKQVDALTGEKKFKDAYFLVVETRKNIITRIEEFMGEITKEVSQKIETANELGVDVTNAKAMFEVAKNTVRSKDYLEAKKILAKIDEEVDNLCKNSLLQEYERMLKTVEEFKGKDVDLSEVLSALERAKSRIDKKLYVEAKLALETVNTKIRTIERIVKLGV